MSNTDLFYGSLGRRIQDFRKARSLTQEQLGFRIVPPVTRASIANIEAGKQGVLAHTLVQLARVLGTTPEGLLPTETGGEDPELRGRVQDELSRKLSVPAEASRRLTEKLFAQTDEKRRKRERATRASHR